MTPENQMFWGQAVIDLYPNVTYMTDWVNAWDKDNNPIDYDSTLVEPKANELLLEYQLAACKQEAQRLLQATDWTATVDISNPQYSNPYLMNQDAFLAYRSAVRAIAVNPVADPVWPTLPTEQWSA